MNRLILIGNGFDLAHGLKTNYHDFILDYLKGCIDLAFNNPNISLNQSKIIERYSDELLSIGFSSLPNIQFDKVSTKTGMLNRINESKSVIQLLNYIQSYEIKIDYRGSGFVNLLFNECVVKNWVDIESLYYEELKKRLLQYNKNKDYDGNVSGVIGNLKHLNNQLEFLKNKLEDYLLKIEKENKSKINSLSDLIHHWLNKNTFIDKSDHLLILNFNYTATPKKYLKVGDEIINIHGELNSDKNPIIFGYGDDVDKNYIEIEDLNENEFFKHIKSFDYFKTSNYHGLLKFIDGTMKREYHKQFEVYIMGHSCGLSDRTMLSTIFENPNCEKIKIFYHTIEDYRNKTYEISRHFKDKAALRKKIVPFPECEPMPQCNQ